MAASQPITRSIDRSIDQLFSRSIDTSSVCHTNRDDDDDETLFIHGILSLQSGILKSRALYNILIVDG